MNEDFANAAQEYGNQEKYEIKIKEYILFYSDYLMRGIGKAMENWNLPSHACI